jgi:hypothetical protein
MNTRLIVDSLGNIVFLQAGFLGAMNNAGDFLLMERMGPGTNYDMPHAWYNAAERQRICRCCALVNTLSRCANQAYAQA